MALHFDPSLWSEDDFDYLRDNSDRFLISQNKPGLLEITAHGYDISDALEDFLGDVLELDEQFITEELDDETQIFRFANLPSDVQDGVVTEISKLK